MHVTSRSKLPNFFDFKSSNNNDNNQIINCYDCN